MCDSAGQSATGSGQDGVRTRGSKWIIAIGSCGYLGYLPASGTVTVAVAGVPAFLWFSQFGTTVHLIIVAVTTAFGVWIHDRGDRLLGEKDSRKLVVDELVGFWIALLFVPGVTWQIVLAAFFLERGLDIMKVWPANVVERRIPGGWGVVGDDVVAGVYTCGLLQILCRFWPASMGLPAGAVI